MGKAWSHERQSGNDEWLTPRFILDALGTFDLDPCASVVRPWPTAAAHFTTAEDGLSRPWNGRVWMNPPYGRETARWMARLRDHGNGIALIFARTDTRMFFDSVWGWADVVMFLRGRLKFVDTAGVAAGTAGAASCLVAFGEANADVLRRCGLIGHVVSVGGTIPVPKMSTKEIRP